MNKYSSICGISARICELCKVFLVTVLAARLLEIEIFGKYSLLLSVFSIVAIIAEFRLQDVILKEAVQNKDLSTIFINSIFIGLIFSLFGYVIFCSVALHPFIGENQFNIYSLFGIIYFLNISRIFKILFIGKKCGGYVLLSEVSSGIISISYAVYLIFYSTDDISLSNILFIRIIDSFVCLLVVAVLFLVKNKITVAAPSLKVVITYLHSSWPLVLSGFSVILYQRMDQLMLKSIRGYELLGIYSAAITLVTMFSLLPIIASQVYAVKIHSVSNSDEFYNEIRMKFLQRINFIGVALSLLYFFVAKTFTVYVFGVSYVLTSAEFAIFSTIPLLTALGASATQIIITDSLQSLVWLKSLIALVINFILNIILINQFGILGAVLATVLSLIIGNFLSNIIISRYRYVFYLQCRSFIRI
jgi:O-antigen/teichoic acid export membrane protein